MKNPLISIGFVTLSIQAFAAQPQLNTVSHCELAGAQHSISLLRSSPIEDSYVYKVRYANDTKFMYDDSDESRGSEVQWQCIADQNKAHVFVVSGEFASNFLQGALFYFDTADGKIERVDFAERNRPRWVRISAQGAQVIFENTGNESSSKYLSYGKNGVSLELSELPITSAAGDSLIDLNAKQ